MGHGHGWGPGGKGAHDGGQDMGTAMDGTRDGAETWGPQRGGMWAHVRGVDMGKMQATAMCTPKGLGCTWHMHKGCGQGQQQSVVHSPGAEAAVLLVDGSEASSSGT